MFHEMVPISVRRYDPVASNDISSITWLSIVARRRPLLASHILLTVLSPEADATGVLSSEKATELTYLIWPCSVLTQVQLLISQILTVLSSEPDTTRMPLDEK